MDAGLLLEEREGTDEPGYQFRHALFQEAAYQSLPRDERRRQHQHIARVLEARFPAVVRTRPEVLAHHHTEAGELALAIPYWCQAGERDLQRMANPEAVAHLTRAQELLGKLPADERHAGEELMVLAGRSRSLAQMRGYNSPEAARTCARALELLRRMDEFPPLLKWSIWILHSYHSMRAEYPLAHEVAERVVRLGGRQKSLELLALGHQLRAHTFAAQGRYRLALESSELALACVRSGPARDWEWPVAVHLAQILAVASSVLSISGRLEQARRYNREALEELRRIDHPPTTAMVLMQTALSCQSRREVGIRSTLPGYLYLLAGIHLRLGQLREGLVAADEALSEARETGQHFMDAELHRIRGELLRAGGQEREARYDFFRAIAVAREQGALLSELRAMVSLGRLLRDTGRPEGARGPLARVLARFEVGEDSVDLTEARALLEELSGGASPSDYNKTRRGPWAPPP